jgi:3',5'-cyclic AMP phosphodiesterase CpdA
MASIRLAIASDLHYTRIGSADSCRPSTAMSGVAGDPMHALMGQAAPGASALPDRLDLRADYLLCPGDITNKASSDGFNEGWRCLKGLQRALGARHLLAATGNHEVSSRAGERDDQPGNSEQAIDPLATIQRHADYPSTALTDDARWIYWGRGYVLIEEPQVTFLLINSSHFHPTTRANEFERGRISDVAIDRLRNELAAAVDRDRTKAFVALLHHHPIPHQLLDIEQDRIDMRNGAQLIEVLVETGVAWFVVHGHKHQGRLIQAQGGQGSPIVMAAGSFGVFLEGDFATKTRLQFYIVEIELLDQAAQPALRGEVRAVSWTGSGWEVARGRAHGLPDRCGFSIPHIDLGKAVSELRRLLGQSDQPYLRWVEVLELVPDLRFLMPNDARILRTQCAANGVGVTWDEGLWFPSEVSLC